MTVKITIIKGLAIDILIEEFDDRDARGQLNAYVATIYRLDKKASSRTLIRRSRLPGAASEIERAIRVGGLQAFRHLTHA